MCYTPGQKNLYEKSHIFVLEKSVNRASAGPRLPDSEPSRAFPKVTGNLYNLNTVHGAPILDTRISLVYSIGHKSIERS